MKAAGFNPFLEQYSWPALAAQRDACPLVVVPLGATEQHGPALPVGTDSLIAERLGAAACAEAKVLMAPVLRYTSSGGHTIKWPGTFSLSPQTFIQTVVHLAQWAESTGWKKLYLVNAHAGNDAPLRVAVDQIRLSLLGRLQVGYADAFRLSAEVEKMFFADVADLHANQAEADLMLHLAPEWVDREAMPAADDPDRTTRLVFSYPVAQTSLNGTTGYPSRGSAERGKVLFEKMVSALVDRLERAKVEQPPLPWSDGSAVPDNFYT